MKKTLCLVLTILMLSACFAVPVIAGDDAGLKYLEAETFCQVSGCDKTFTGDVVIPETYNGLPVAAVRAEAFKNSRIRSVTVPASVTTIGSSAFYQCESLATVYFKGENCKLGSNVFAYCSSLVNVTLPSALVSVPVNAFTHCDSLSHITIPDTVTEISSEAFSSTALKNSTIPANVAEIAADAYSGCSSLKKFVVDTKSTYFKETDGVLYSKDGKTLVQYPLGKTDTAYSVTAGTETIEKLAFAKNSVLESVTMPESLRTILSYAFSECSALSEVKLNKGLVKIDSMAFAQCKNLKSITIPSTTESYSSAFYHSGLEKVILENGVTEISSYAFDNCTSLAEIKVPDSVKSIKIGAFNNCTSLRIIPVPSSVESIDKNAFSGIIANISMAATKGTYGETFANENNIPCLPFTEIAILNFYEFNGITVDYRTTITFHAEVKNPSGNPVVWHVTGAEYEANGNDCTVTEARSNFTIYCSVTDAAGSEIKSAEENVKVNTGLWAKIVAFFRWIFGLLPKLDQ